VGIATKIVVHNLVLECVTIDLFQLRTEALRALVQRGHGLHMVRLCLLGDAVLHLFGRAESVCSSTPE
jgi:hypothetical protein